MTEQLAAPYQDLDTLGNFIDNHDNPRIAQVCNHDLARVKNAVAWTLLIKGIPIVYYGTEELFEDKRESLWNKGYNGATDMYQYIKRLNGLRKMFDWLPLSDQTVVPTTSEKTLVFTRGGKDRMWVYLNNWQSSQGAVEYCGELPPLRYGHIWVEALSSVDAVFQDGCFTAEDAYPKVLISKPVSSWSSS